MILAIIIHFDVELYWSKLMVVGGFNEPANDAVRKVEIINLSDQDLTCLQPDYPTADYSSVGTFINDKAFVCGGTDSPTLKHYNDCNSYANGVRHCTIKCFSNIFLSIKVLLRRCND